MGEEKFEWKPPRMFFQPLPASLSLGQAPYYRHPAIMDEVQPPLSEIQSSKPLCTTQSDLPRYERGGEGLEREKELAFSEDHGLKQTIPTPLLYSLECGRWNTLHLNKGWGFKKKKMLHAVVL